MIDSESKDDGNSFPKVSVVIPSIGKNPDILSRLVRDLVRPNSFVTEVIVSCSGERSVPEFGSGVTVLSSQVPLLASEARNRGARIARGEFIFFIDDDNEIERDTVETLYRLLESNQSLVEVGPSMFYGTERERVFCLGVSHRGRFSRTRTILDPQVTDGERVIESEALPNAFMVRRKQFEAIGGFDEKAFPMDFEESDLAFRLRERFGGRLVCSLDTKVWHFTPVSVRQQLAAKSLKRAYYSARNRPIFIARHLGFGPLLSYLFLGQFVAVASRAVGIFLAENHADASRPELFWAYLKGTVDGIPMALDQFRVKSFRVASDR